MSLTKISNNSLSAISSLPASIPTGALTLLSTQTASSSASISFTSGIDSTYDSYVFKFYNIHPATDEAHFQFQCSTDSGSTYATTITSTHFRARHYENGTGADLAYLTAHDAAQSTSFLTLLREIGNDSDECASGYLHLFNPASSVYVKHFIARGNVLLPNAQSNDNYVAGYGNTTSAINAIKFQMSSGNIDDGIIKMYGVS